MALGKIQMKLMKISKNRWPVFSRSLDALLQGVVVLGFGACTVLPPQTTTLGSACALHSDCQSGICEDGVCCDSVCPQTCMACNVPGKAGTCSLVPKFSEDPSANFECISPAQCDGAGTCRTILGQTCGWQVECWSGFCAGVCCETQCNETCMTCDDTGTCVPTPAFVGDLDCSAPYATCNGQGECIYEIGQTCTDATNCVSGHCVDGVCCENACTDTCKGCAVPGRVGMCSNVPAYEGDPSAAILCDGPEVTCNGSGECKNQLGGACTTNGQCASGSCSNGTCQPPRSQTGPLQWQWSNDQTVCIDPNGVGFLNQYPTVKIRQLVARDDESLYGVGDYTLPSQGLPSEYGVPPPPPDMYQDYQVLKDGPHAFQLDVAASGASASWMTVAQYTMHECLANSCRVKCDGLTCFNATAGLGPFIEPAGGDVVFFRKTLRLERDFGSTTEVTCEQGDFAKRASPQWALGTNDVCAHEEIVFAGDAAGNVVMREDDRLKKYDPSGAVLLDVPTPFDFVPTALGLSAMGNIHAAAYSSAEIRLARTGPSGTLVWTKVFPHSTPMDFRQTMDLSVDASGNDILAFYADDTLDLGNGPMLPIGTKDIVLAKFDVQGNVEWAKRMGSGDFAPIAFSMRKTGADDIALLVFFTGKVDLGDGLLQSSPVLIKYDANGNFVWRADLLPLYPTPGPEVSSAAISGHPSGAVFVAGSGYGLASLTAEPYCDLGLDSQGFQYTPGTFPRPLRMFAAKYGP
jgi:hypothetical protein